MSATTYRLLWRESTVLQDANERSLPAAKREALRHAATADKRECFIYSVNDRGQRLKFIARRGVVRAFDPLKPLRRRAVAHA